MGLLGWLFGTDRASTRKFRGPLPSGKFGLDRHKPPGQWVQTTMTVKVVGLQHRRSDVDAFFAATAAAERNRTPYGVRLKPDPNNPHDRNAIAVDGYAGGGNWHIGFLDRDTAAEISRDLISAGIPIEAELYSLWNGDDGYVDANVIVLAPSGYGLKARLRRH